MADPDLVELLEVVSDDLDPFDDDTPLVCGIETPEECTACQ